MKEPSGQSKAYGRVINYIQGEILRGALKKGEKLPPERELAEQLHVGRNSVREAMRTLSLMGFITSTQGAGNFVSCDMEQNLIESTRMMMMMGEIDFRQVSELRQGLERESALLAARNITPEQLKVIEELAREMREEPDSAKTAIMDRKLHRLLAEASGNRLIIVILWAMSEAINEFIGTMHCRMMEHDIYGKQLQNSHQMLVMALREHDERRAVQSMREHFEVVDIALEDLYFGQGEGKEDLNEGRVG